ncbi:MAG TPA: class I SAM-dependent methyltransferase [Caulobacter sp.]|nr:class I SAM-dependent methyltransferase [Caulobacter sp.]
MLKRVDYDEAQHAVYARGRQMPAGALARWMARFAEQLPAARPLTILDLGSGVGRLTPALAETFGGPVHGVEPSTKMREIAEATAAHPAVRYHAGEAARIPLPDHSVDAVLLFLSFHHVPDRAAGAVEIARVLKPGGRVLVRSPFRDRMGGNWFYRYFPRAEAIEKAMFPPLAEVTGVFADAGLAVKALVEVEEVYAANEAEAAERLKLRAISTFEHMTEAEIEEGFARLDAKLALGADPNPSTGRSDLLVLG